MSLCDTTALRPILQEWKQVFSRADSLPIPLPLLMQQHKRCGSLGYFQMGFSAAVSYTEQNILHLKCT